MAAGTDLLLAAVLDNLPLAAFPVEYAGLVCPVELLSFVGGVKAAPVLSLTKRGRVV